MKLRSAILLFYLLSFEAIDGFSQFISAGDKHTMLLCKNTNMAQVWGHNTSGQLGISTNLDSHVPITVNSLFNVKAVNAGYLHSLFLRGDSTVWACGYNGHGELGDGTKTSRNQPVKVQGLSGIVAIAAGTGFSLFLKGDGTVWACGDNGAGALGDSTLPMGPDSIPDKMPGITNVIAIAAKGGHAMMLKSDSTVWTCGLGTFGRLGYVPSNPNYSPVPKQIPGLSRVAAIASGDLHSLFLMYDGTVRACGWNALGELGNGTTNSFLPPGQVTATWQGKIKAIAGGGHFSLFLNEDSSVWACGYNPYGQLADGTISTRLSSVLSSNTGKVVSIAAGGYHSAYLLSDGTVKTVGYNDAGQLGDNSTWEKHLPVQVTGTCFSHSPISTEELSDGRFKIYPNPGSGDFLIINTAHEAGIILISDIHGREVRTIFINGSSEEIGFDLSDFESGIYFYKTIMPGYAFSGKLFLIK